MRAVRNCAVRMLALWALLWTLPTVIAWNVFGKPTKSRPSAPTTDALSPAPLYDLAIIGGGVVGVSSALAAAQAPFSKKVVLIDAPRASGALMKDEDDLSLGGPTGLFSKALRDTSKRIKVSTLRGMGLREESVWNEIISACVDLAASNANDIERQLEMAKVDYVRGRATFANSGKTDRLQVEMEDGSTTTVMANRTLIATGSQPFQLPGIPFDGRRVFDSDSINSLSFLPRSIVITGSGIIGVEFAKIFRSLGAEVTLVIRDRVPRNALMKIGLDKDIAATLVADLLRSGIHFERGAEVDQFDVPRELKKPMKITLKAEDGGALPRGRKAELQCDAYLAAVGRTPNTSNLNLEAAGINTDKYGGLLVDQRLTTTAPAGNVFAAGDILGRPFLASTGVAQGRAAVSAMFFDEAQESSSAASITANTVSTDGLSRAGASFDPTSLSSNPFAFPTGVWSSPEAAYYGYTTQQAEEMGIDASEGIALYAECLRGRVFSPTGLRKLVYERPTGRIVGVHICGEDACELIHYGMELVKTSRTVRELSDSLFSAVTFHELYKIAAMAALDEAGARKRRAEAGRALAKRQQKYRKTEEA